MVLETVELEFFVKTSTCNVKVTYFVYGEGQLLMSRISKAVNLIVPLK